MSKLFVRRVPTDEPCCRCGGPLPAKQCLGPGSCETILCDLCFDEEPCCESSEETERPTAEP